MKRFTIDRHSLLIVVLFTLSQLLITTDIKNNNSTNYVVINSVHQSITYILSFTRISFDMQMLDVNPLLIILLLFSSFFLKDPGIPPVPPRYNISS
jgi:hypothetical protein